MNSKLNSRQLHLLTNGALGKERLAAGETSTAGKYFRYIFFLEATTFTSITDEELTGTKTAFAGDTFPQGALISGRFHTLDVATGLCIAYYDFPSEDLGQ